MEKMNVPAVGPLTAADLSHLRVRMSVYLNELERSYWREVSIFENKGASAAVERARHIYNEKLEYASLLIDKLDETVRAIMRGELHVSPEAVAHLPRKANR